MAVKIVPSFSAFTFLKEVMEGSHCEGPNSFLFQQGYDTQYFAVIGKGACVLIEGNFHMVA